MGVSGRRDRGGAAWRPYPLVVIGERVRRGRAPVPTRVGGTGKGGGRGRRAGSAGWARWVSWARWPRGVWGVFLSLSFFFFSVLFHFKVFSLLLKMCFLHHNYLCNIWRPPNIFVSILKTFIVDLNFKFEFDAFSNYPEISNSNRRCHGIIRRVLL